MREFETFREARWNRELAAALRNPKVLALMSSFTVDPVGGSAAVRRHAAALQPRAPSPSIRKF
jgi:hypothetical protein